MIICEISVAEIIHKESPYRLARCVKWSEVDSDYALLAASFREIGVIQPLLVQKTGSGYHLVDGFKRLAFLKQRGMDKVLCSVLLTDGENGADCDMAAFKVALCESGVGRESRFIDRLHAVMSALHAGVPRKQILELVMPALGFDSHDRVLRRLESIAMLPGEILEFCAEKNFSMKQCYHLTRHPPGVVDLVFSWRKQLSLSASVVNDLCESLKDYLRAHDLKADEFAGDSEVRELLASNLAPHDKTAGLRRLVHKRRYPLLTRINQQMQEITDSLDLPAKAHLQWDRTLENREIKMTFVVMEPKEWQRIVARLQSEKVLHAVEELFENL